ncbi:MAG TPA: NAD(P)-binding domain-containing protein [Virgibacillus sp.]|nr:NAD(P)-binding domain-containing protein [Virgibacillus sp.]
MKISFIGLGIMGLPMAKHLFEAGYLSKVYNRTKSKTKIFEEKGVQISDSPKEAAQGADIIFIIVSDSADVKEVVLGSEGVLEGARPGSIVVDMSSINPEVSKKIGQELAKLDVEMIDAPVSGGEQGAINAELAIMVGGAPSAVAQVRPYLEVMGKSITHLGPLGSGGYAKLANQVIVGIELQAVAEAFHLANHAGLDFEKLYEAIRYGLAGSKVLDHKIDNLISGSFEPGFAIDLHLKDMKNAILAAKEQNLHLPFTQELKALLQKMSESGYGDLDHSGMYKFIRENA